QVVPAEVDATIRAATAQNNPEMLEKPAAALEAARQYGAAQRLMESAVAMRAEVSGKQSLEYGTGLLKIADLERKQNHTQEAETFYRKALLVLGDRPEAAPALIYLGLQRKDPEEAIEFFQKAQRLDPSHAGPAMMWMARIREHEEKPAEAEELYKS